MMAKYWQYLMFQICVLEQEFSIFNSCSHRKQNETRILLIKFRHCFTDCRETGYFHDENRTWIQIKHTNQFFIRALLTSSLLSFLCVLWFGLNSCLLDGGHVGIGSDNAQMGVGPKKKKRETKSSDTVRGILTFKKIVCRLTVVCREAKTLPTVWAGSGLSF